MTWAYPVHIPEGRTLSIHQSEHQTIEVLEADDLRWLQTDRQTIQSAISLSRPHQLVLPYMQAMMATLLFQAPPKRTLLLGLGGGAMVRFLHHYLPDSHISAVEIDQEMINICRKQFTLPDSESVEIINAEAGSFIHNTAQHYDTLFIDLYSADCQPELIKSNDFYSDCSEKLTQNGALVLNLLTDDEDEFRSILWKIRRCFHTLTLCMKVPGHKNTLLLAFKCRPQEILYSDLQQRSKALSEKYELDFNEFVDNLFTTNPLQKGELIL